MGRLSRTALLGIIGGGVLAIAGVGAIIGLAGEGLHAPIYTPPPLSAPAPARSAGHTINTGFAQFPAIEQFTAGQTSNHRVRLEARDKSGSIIVQVGGIPSTGSNQQIADALLQGAERSSPDARRCGADRSGPGLAGRSGTIATVVVVICETYTPQNGQAFKAVDAYVVGAAHDSTGAPIDVLVNLFASQKNFQKFVDEIPDGWTSQVQFNATP